MQQEDAEQIAKIIGEELTSCSYPDMPGLIVALNSLEDWMARRYPDFDALAYRTAANAAAGFTVARDADW